MPNSTDKCIMAIVGSIGTTNHHGTWGRKARLVGEWGMPKRIRGYTYTARASQWHKIPCYPSAHLPEVATKSTGHWVKDGAPVHIFRLRGVTTSILHISGGRLDAVNQ
ncbi:hypothetical protein TNCV_2905971 [Trichonephila clavipes]|nr:hypothetical protein TNCV_2905971 [Trichonephila clavipes]